MWTDAQIEELWRAQTRGQRASRRGAADRLRAVADATWTPLLALLGALPWLEGAVGADGSDVAVVDRLDVRALTGLFQRRDVCAVHVRRFCTPEVAARLSALAAGEQPRWSLRGEVETDTFFAADSVPGELAHRSRADFFRYFAGWEGFVARQREASGGAWPVDRLRLALDEGWPGGARLGDFAGGRARPAIVRVMRPETRSVPALGFIHRDDPRPMSAARGVASASIYLDVPREGGELHVFGVDLARGAGVRDRVRAAVVETLLHDAFDAESQDLLRDLLPPPRTIRPEAGDLVILHAARPHSVSPARSGVRVSLQSFVHYRAPGALEITS
jgi:hypothetical protein